MRLLRVVTACVVLCFSWLGLAACAGAEDSDRLAIDSWQMQFADKVTASSEAVSSAGFELAGWYRATVPGTVLSTLVDNHVYPDPIYGENLRPGVIPDSLARTAYWYRTTITIPQQYRGRHVWLHFDGINYSAAIWVNGNQVGTMRGAFCRGTFDISPVAKAGQQAVVAVLIAPQPHPGIPHQHTVRDGVGHNGGVTALDGPSFLSTIGWDWIPAIPDRATGIWQKVWLSSTGPVMLQSPLVTTDVKLPGRESADLKVSSAVQNLSDQSQRVVLKGEVEGIRIERRFTLSAHAMQQIEFSPSTDPAMRLVHPRLWWPNGYGPQNLYRLRLSLATDDGLSDEQQVTFGVRSIGYSINSSDALAFVVNGVPIFIRGGDWGLDDAMKRIPPARLEALIRLHQHANLNMIRNWVGQSTSEDFFALCDKYGLLVWDEFFQPNPGDGPNPTDLKTYMENVRDTVLQYRNHPSIALWCARNEGNPPQEIDAQLKKMLAELDPTRLYQANSSDGRSLRSHGPYRWRVPRDFYWMNEGFKSETGSMSIPTIESIQGMMPQKDWETINDDWAEHDFARGAASGDQFPGILAQRYGKIVNLADFVRKSQLADYEAFLAMYEGRNAMMFRPATGILTWMSNSAHPSFVWQLYHYDLEPDSAYFAVKSAAEPVHVQLNQVTGMVQVANSLPTALVDAGVHVEVFNLDGKLSSEQSIQVDVPSSSTVSPAEVVFHEPLSPVFFVRLTLVDKSRRTISTNFYWMNHPEHSDHFEELDRMPRVELGAIAKRTDSDGDAVVRVTLQNPSRNIALMAHLQLRQKETGQRVLPSYYSDNYVSLIGGESRSIEIRCPLAALDGKSPLVVLDGWNVSVKPFEGEGVTVEINENAQVDHWPATGLPVRMN